MFCRTSHFDIDHNPYSHRRGELSLGIVNCTPTEINLERNKKNEPGVISSGFFHQSIKKRTVH